MAKSTVFVLGDSISIHYGPYLKKIIEGNFNYDRKRGEDLALTDLDNLVGANGGDSAMVLEFLEGRGNKIGKVDYLLLNCGLHDIKADRETKNKQIGLDEYRANLKRIATAAKELADEILWISTTPVNYHQHHEHKGFDRYNEDVKDYNAAAEIIMKEESIKVIDLYSFTIKLEKEPHYDGVHFKPEVSRLQAAFIAGFLSGIEKV